MSAMNALWHSTERGKLAKISQYIGRPISLGRPAGSKRWGELRPEVPNDMDDDMMGMI